MKRWLITALLLLACLSAQAALELFLIAVPSEQVEHVAPFEDRMRERYQMNLSLSLGESFMGLQYLIEGDAWRTPQTAAGRALMGGRPVKRQDNTWPATLVLTPEEVKEVAGALERITIESLLARYEPMAMDQAGIDPLGWQERESAGFDELASKLRPLQHFFRSAAAQGLSVLSVVTRWPIR